MMLSVRGFVARAGRVALITLSISIPSTTLSQETFGTGTCGRGQLHSAECRHIAAETIQTNFRESFPNLHVSSEQDVIVFSDTSSLNQNDELALFVMAILRPDMQSQLCKFGFNTFRLAFGSLAERHGTLPCLGDDVSGGDSDSIDGRTAGHEAVNPKSQTYHENAARVLKAAMTAAAPHQIRLEVDEGLKQLNDAGKEVTTFWFLTKIPNYSFPVDAIVSVEPIDDSSARVQIYFCKHGGTNIDVPSAAFELRKAQLEAALQRKLVAIEEQRQALEIQWQTHGISEADHALKDSELVNEEAAARKREVIDEHEARRADIAQMPTSTFSAMAAEAEKFFNRVQQKLPSHADN